MASVIWGLSFVAQSVGMEKVGTFTFNGIRLLIGSAVLLPFVIRNSKRDRQKLSSAEYNQRKHSLVTSSLICGTVLFIGSNLQQQAFLYIEVGKVGFLTAIYMVLVPVLGLIIFKTKPRMTVWAAVIIGLAGLYFLCIPKSGGLSLGKGELLTLTCAVAFAFHIIAIDRCVGKTDGVSLSMGQFFVAGVLSVICTVLFEEPSVDAIISVAPSWLYAGIMSCGVAFTFQILGQKYTEPAIASLLLSMESVFSVLFGWLILKQSLSMRELFGCAVMFMAIVLAQLPKRKKGSVFDA